MKIGIPKEVLPGERRVAALPETVCEHVQMGFHVCVEATAGDGVLVSDSDFAEAGAEIIHDTERVFSESDIVLKVKEPRHNSTVGKHEAQMMRDGAILIGFLHPAAPSNHAMVHTLRDKRLTAFTMDSIPRTSRAQRMDALTSMSTIAGYKCVVMAAHHLPRLMPMIGTAVGTVKPAKVLVIGVGVVGLQAIATAKRLGAVVSALDIRAEARKAAVSLGVKVPTFDIPQNLAVAENGYARALTKEWLLKEEEVLRPLVAESDVMILSALVPGEQAPILITEDMIESMRPGSVVIDVSVDQGGNCALTRAGEEVTIRGVLICGVQNIPGSVPIDASWLYSHNILEYVRLLFKNGPGNMDLGDEIVQASLVVHDGRIVHEGTLKAMQASRAQL